MSDTDEKALQKGAEAERFVKEMNLHAAGDWKRAADLMREAADLYEQRYNELVYEAVGAWCRHLGMIGRPEEE